jgi:hypothetical protein
MYTKEEEIAVMKELKKAFFEMQGLLEIRDSNLMLRDIKNDTVRECLKIMQNAIEQSDDRMDDIKSNEVGQ